MKYIRKIIHYFRYLMGLLIQNPFLVFKEFLEDFKKDKRAINLKKIIILFGYVVYRNLVQL